MNLRRQVLIYPVLDFTRQKDASANNYLLTAQDLPWFARHLAGEKSDLANPRLSVLLQASFEGLPPTMIIQAEYDHLNPEIEEFINRLEKEEIPIEVLRSKGTFHGYITLKNWYAPEHDPFREIRQFLSKY